VQDHERAAVGISTGLDAVRRLAAGARERRARRRLPLRPRRARHLRRPAEERLSGEARVLAELLRGLGTGGWGLNGVPTACRSSRSSSRTAPGGAPRSL